MSTMGIRSVPRLRGLPSVAPLEGAVRIEIEDGKPVLRASSSVRERIEALLLKQRETGLTAAEEREFDGYEDLDHDFSLVNRIVCDVLGESGEQAATHP